MASGIELATAYCSIVAETSRLKKDINAAFDEADKSSARASKKIGQNLSSGLGGTKNSAAKAGAEAAAEYERALKSSMRGERIGEMIGRPIGKGIGLGMKAGIAGAAAAATGAVALLSTTLTKGFARLQTIDQATFKLQALGSSAEEVKTIMDSATKSVKGTAFSLADAATASASAVAAGIKPGQELTKYLGKVADSAAVAGTSFDEMASIFNKVQTNNKAYTDDLQQLADRGLPIFQWLRDEYGVSAEALTKMVEDGKVSAADFQAAIDKNIGGAAQKMGQSFSGAVDNMHASVARLGANFLSTIFGGGGVSALAGPTEAVNKITEKFNELDAWVQAHQGQIKNFFQEMTEGAKWVVDKVADISEFLTEHPDLVKNVVVAFAAWKTIQGVTSLITSLQAVSTLLSVTIPASAATGAAASTASLAPLIGALKMLPLAFVGLGGVKDSADLGLPQVQDNPDGSLSLGPFAQGSLGGGPNASNQRRGRPSVGPFGDGGGSVLQDVLNGGSNSYGMPAGSNSGGYGGGGVQFPPWVNEIASTFGIKPSTYSGHQESNRNEPGYAPNPSGQNRGIDWSGPVENMQRFADYLATIPGAVEQVIWQNPATGSAIEIAGGRPQPGYFSGDLGGHQDHVHTRQSAPIPLPRFADGGAARGPGGPTADRIPAWLSNGEHVLTAAEVDAMGGQENVYAFRDALRRSTGGEIMPLAVPWGVDPIGGPDKTPSAGRFTPWWDMDWLPPENPDEVGPGDGKWWFHGPGKGKSPFKFSPIGKGPGFRKPLPTDPAQADERIKFWEQSLPRYDNGGWWPSGTAGMNTTGKDEYVLTPEEIEELKKQGIDPATVQHGQGVQAGLFPGPTPEKLAELTSPPGLTGGAELLGGSRTEGYIPAGAGSTAVAGESFMSGIYSMGAEVINGIIDQAASAASSAAGMAATAFAPGSGGAASGLTSAAIGMGTQAAKRGVEYGAQMLGIGTDALIEQLTPFGAPRILSTDPTAFMPQQALMEAATTSLEKAFQPQQPQGPEAPEPVTAGASAHVNELEPGAEGGPDFSTTINATVKDVNELGRVMTDQQKLKSMQYTGRP